MAAPSEISNRDLEDLIGAYERNPSILFCDEIVICLKSLQAHREFVRSVVEYDRYIVGYDKPGRILADIEKQAAQLYVPDGNKK